MSGILVMLRIGTWLCGVTFLGATALAAGVKDSALVQSLDPNAAFSEAVKGGLIGVAAFSLLLFAIMFFVMIWLNYKQSKDHLDSQRQSEERHIVAFNGLTEAITLMTDARADSAIQCKACEEIARDAARELRRISTPRKQGD